MKHILPLLLISIMLLTIRCSSDQNVIEKWGMFEIELTGPSDGNPYKDIQLTANFVNNQDTIRVTGFYDGNSTYKIRFMPHQTGTWTYTTFSNSALLNNKQGYLTVTKPSSSNHGPVEVVNTFHFQYADGTPYKQIGTTCYAWVHQGDSLEEITLVTLKNAPFNKLRMCIFPKDYIHNNNEPVYYPYQNDDAGNQDLFRFNPVFWAHLEKRIMQLQELGIEADIILLHPYDRWGYARMTDHEDDFYIRYAVARLSAYRNIWWSLANEYDFMKTKTMDDWHRIFQIVYNEDPYKHLRSIHNGYVMYDHSKPWVTHASIQRTSFDSVPLWKEWFKKPLVFDECRYEGNIMQGWGNLSAEEMTAMFWRGLITTSYSGHGETYEHPEDILWWSKGGMLHGQSPERIAFFKQFFDSIRFNRYQQFDNYSSGIYGQEYVYYFDTLAPDQWHFTLPPDRRYRIEIMDTWNMTSKKSDSLYYNDFTLSLPGKNYIAVKISLDKLLFPIGRVEAKSGNLSYNENFNTILFTDSTEVLLNHSYYNDIKYAIYTGTQTNNYKRYTAPLKIDQSCTLSAVVFDDEREGISTEYILKKIDLHESLNVADPKQGLEFSYYEGKWTKVPDFRSLQPLRSGLTQDINLNTIEHREDYFGILFNGYIKVPLDGVYTFYLVSDDGAFLILNDHKIIDNDGQHGMEEARGAVGLKAGFHKLEIPYFDNWYDHGLKLMYYHENTGRQTVGAEMFYH